MIALGPPLSSELRARHALLDVRVEAEFRRAHLPGSGNLPVAELEARRAELPSRDVAVLVLAATAAEARTGAAELERLGYLDVAWLDAPLADAGVPLDSDGAGVPLWRPAAFLAEVLPGIPRGRALDVAAGSGREAVTLALHGFEVEAWDRAPEALARASDLAARHGVRIETVVCDLEWRGATLPAERYDLVVCFRFLHRPLLPAMALALRPGGHLVYETYRTGQERFGRPTHRRFLLEPGELRAAFPGLEVLREEECTPAGGPLTARLWARRPGAAAASG